MQNHSMLLTITVLLTSLFFSSCASTHAPSGWLPDPNNVPTNIYGGWIEIQSRQGKLWGELIAVTKDSVFVADTVMHSIASGNILSATLVIYDASGLMGAGVLLGTLSTLSNGGFLIFTAPMWLIGGSIAAGSRSHDPIIDYPHKPLKHFVPFARYPQGLPPDLDRSTIKIKGSK